MQLSLFPILEPNDGPILKPLTRREERLFQSPAMMSPYEVDEIFYQHSTLCQTSLPYRNPRELRRWEHRNGKVALVVTAGELGQPDGTIRNYGLPWGTRSRIPFIHIVTHAKRLNSPIIPMGRNVTDFTRLVGLETKGSNIRELKNHILALSAAHMRLMFFPAMGHAITVDAPIVDGFDIWQVREDGWAYEWPVTLRLNDKFFANLQEKSVPLNPAAIRVLQNSPLKLDVYCWLAQRLHRIEPGKPQFVSWEALRVQFGVMAHDLDDFRRKFKMAIVEVLTQYRDARVESGPRGMTLHHSRPPVLKMALLVS